MPFASTLPVNPSVTRTSAAPERMSRPSALPAKFRSLAASGVNLKKLSPRHALAITWTLDGRPIGLRYEPSPWLGYAVFPSDGGWEVRRAETRPDVRVDVVAGEVTRSLFDAVEAAGGAAQLAVDLFHVVQLAVRATGPITDPTVVGKLYDYSRKLASDPRVVRVDGLVDQDLDDVGDRVVHDDRDWPDPLAASDLHIPVQRRERKVESRWLRAEANWAASAAARNRRGKQRCALPQ